MAIEVISSATLNTLWESNGVSDKRESGALTSRVAYRSSATNPEYRGGESRIVVLTSPNGHHIGTVHEIVMPDGSIPHSHPKDYTRRDCSRVRAPEWHETLPDQ